MYINLAGLKFAIYSQGSRTAGPSAFTSRVLGLQAVLLHLVYVVLQMESTDLCLLGKHLVYWDAFIATF